MGTPTQVNNFLGWSTSTNANIERLMDEASYSSAHPDDTLVIAGPPRLGTTIDGTDGGYGAFAAIGMLQNITINQQKPFQPLMAIGSSRSFFVASKAQGSAQIQRLFMNKQNLLRRLYSNAVDVGGLIPYQDTDQLNPASASMNPDYLINLDSEFFLIPFGLGMIFKNKARSSIGGLYMELAVIPNFTLSVQAGQSMVMEAVSVFFDRVIPLPVATATGLMEKYNAFVSPAASTGTT